MTGTPSITVGLWWAPEASSPAPQVEVALHPGHRADPIYLSPSDAVLVAYRILSVAAAANAEIDVDALLATAPPTIRTSPALIVPTTADGRLLKAPIRNAAGEIDEGLFSLLRGCLDGTPEENAIVAANSVEDWLVERCVRIGGDA